MKDHHEGYTTWEEFERNQRLLADNANRRSNMGRRSVRRGEALLAGLFLCARCGKKLQVSYSGDPPKQRYVCAGPNNDTFGNKCISFGGLRSDRAVAQEILGYLISPLRETNVGNRADYENNDERADANPREPFFHLFASLAIRLGCRKLDYAERV